MSVPTTLPAGAVHLAELADLAGEDPRLLVGRALQAARDVLDMEVAYLAHLDDAEQLFQAVLPDTLIPGVETGRRIARNEAYCDRLIAGTISSCVPDTRLHPETADMALTRAGVRSYVGVPVELPGGRLDGTLCCLSRSPDPRVAEQELRFMRVLARMIGDQLARIEMRHQQDVQREGLAQMALHDLKAPVTAVRGYAELLADEPGDLSDEQLGYVERIRRAAGQLDRLAMHLLDISRARGAEPEAPHETIDLGEIVREAVEVATPPAGDAGVELDAAIAPDLMVEGDADALLRVAENLVGNAVKYTPGGGRVDVNVTREGPTVVVRVVDTGLGIPAEEQDRVFETFYRAANGRRITKGSGLGLAVCRRIVEQHGGSLSLVSAEGRGTTVTLGLPAYGPS